MNWNKWIRQIHRWLSIAFTVAVIVNVIAMVLEKQAVWVGLRRCPAVLLCSPALHVRAAVCRNGAARRRTDDAMAGKMRNGGPQEGRKARASSPAATRRSRRPTATPPCRPTSRPCRAGNATSGAASTRSSCAPSPACTRPSSGTRRFYGIEGQGWFLGFHCFTKYVKVAFFRGASLRPVPPGESKQKEVRYLDIHEDDQLDEAQFAAWVKQASQLPGERM